MQTLKSYVYTRLLPVLKRNPPIRLSIPAGMENEPMIAAICDTMTWKSLCHGQAVVSLAPRSWRAGLCSRQIRFLFCEAAWSGAESSLWRGQVYRDRRVRYENRRALLDILEYCKAKSISTVFWAKEDPAYFQHEIYDFTDTALKFDYILTTAQECIPKYHAMGHENVHLWPFGFSPEIYHPPQEPWLRENVAVFAGSWFSDHPQRCRDLAGIFDMVLDAGIALRIYDRHSAAGRPARPFPEKYRPFVMDAVPYEGLGDIYRNAEYVINVNTVCDSGTMFARRVYEAMACGCIVITNEALGLRRQFRQSMWYLGEGFDLTDAEHIRQQNVEHVFSSHTWGQRMEQLYEILKERKVNK